MVKTIAKIHEAYRVSSVHPHKIARAKANGQKLWRCRFDKFTNKFFNDRYGLRKTARRSCKAFVSAVIMYAGTHPRIQLFLTLVGLHTNDLGNATPVKQKRRRLFWFADFVLPVLVHCFPDTPLDVALSSDFTAPTMATNVKLVNIVSKLMRHNTDSSPSFQSFQMAVGAITVFDITAKKKDSLKARRTATVPIEKALLLMMKLVDIEDDARANHPGLGAVLIIQRITKRVVKKRLERQRLEAERLARASEETAAIKVSHPRP